MFFGAHCPDQNNPQKTGLAKSPLFPAQRQSHPADSFLLVKFSRRAY
jgi:hypothetical protein